MATKDLSFAQRMARSVRVLVIAGFALAAGSASAVEISNGDKTEVTGEKTDIVFAHGKTAHVQVKSTHDVFAIGGDVTVDKTTADHVFSAGQTVTVTDGDARDYFGAAKDLRLESGQSGDAVIAMGESVQLKSAFHVTGSAILMGKSLTIESPIGGQLIAAGQDVRLDSAVTGDVRLEGTHIVIGPNARIGGDLSYRGTSVEISPQAVITGKKTILPPNEHRHGKMVRTPMQHFASKAWGVASFLVMVLVFAGLLPGAVGRAGGLIARNPVVPVVAGLVGLIGIPILCFALLFTVIGIGAAGMLMLFWCLGLLLGGVATASGVGHLIRSLAGQGKGETGYGALILWSLLGGVIVAGLGAVPFIGGWVWFVACILGFGALLAQGLPLKSAKA